MSKSKEVKFDPNRFDEYNLPKTNLRRLTRDVFWILSKMPEYSEEVADKKWDDYVKHIDDEWKAKCAKRDAEREKRSKFELEEYEKCFMENMIPIVNGKEYKWTDEIEDPKDPTVKFKVRRGIGCGSYNEDKNKMRAEIAGKYINSTLELWEGAGKYRWRIYVSFKLR